MEENEKLKVDGGFRCYGMMGKPGEAGNGGISKQAARRSNKR